MYAFMEPGKEIDSLLQKAIAATPKPKEIKRAARPELDTNYSTSAPANLELINHFLDHGFSFQETTRRTTGPFKAQFKRDDKVFEGEGATQLMANCIAALKVADYLDSILTP